MADTSLLLGYLKWAAIGLGAAGALWGLLARKPTTEDEHGRRRLTPSGFVTLAIITASALISAISFGFESLAKQEEKAAAAESGRIEAEKQRIRDDRAIVTEANTRATRAEQRATAAEQRAALADQRATTIALAAEDERRTLALGQEVAAGASRNLQRTGDALVQIERVLQPLEPLAVTITLEIPRTAPGMAAWSTRLAAQVAREDSERRAAKAAGYDRIKAPFEPTRLRRILPDDPAYPKFTPTRDETDLAALLATIYVGVAFTADPARLATIAADRSERDIPGDLQFTFTDRNTPPIIEFVATTGALQINLRADIPLDRMKRTGAIVSFPDLERSLALVDLRGNIGNPVVQPWLVPVKARIEGRSRSYTLAPGSFRRVPANPNRAIYALPALVPEPR